MPTRILRDWTDSEKLHAVGEQGESLFARILMKADDYGCYVANPKLLKSTCYPLRDDLRDADMTRRLAACETAGLLSVYEVDQAGASRWIPAGDLAGAAAVGSKRYLVVHNFGQRPRNSVRKFPEPPTTSPQVAATCGNSPRTAATRGDSRPYSETYSETETETLSAGAGDGESFDSFWNAWPTGGRKADRKGCAKIWVREKLDANVPAVMAGLKRWKRSQEWADQGGKFIPAPATWLNQGRWEADPPAAKERGDGSSDEFDVGPGYVLPDHLRAVLDDIHAETANG